MKTILTITLLLAAALGLNAQAVQRSLLANPTDNATKTIYIYSSQIPQSLSQGYIYVDSEVMLVQTTFLSPSVVTTNSIVILTVARGYLGTTPTAHSANALVLYGYPTQFLATDPTGPCVPYGTQYLSYLNQRFFSCGPNSTWFAVTTSNAASAASLSNGTTGTGEIVLQNVPTIISPNLTGTPTVNGLRIAAFRVIALPSSCVAGTDPAVIFDSGGQDAVYVCDNTGHYSLPPGGSTTILGGAVTGAGGANVIASGQNGLVLSSAGGTSTTAVAAPSGAVVGTTDTQVLTHKDLTDATNTFRQLNQNTTGTAALANALTATSNCAVGSATTGISTAGAAQNCTPAVCANLLAYGGDNGGTVSNNAAWTAVLASFGTAPVCVDFSGGTFYFATSPSWTAANATTAITLRGQGGDNSKLLFPSGQNGIRIFLNATSNAVNVTGLSFVTQGAGGTTGLLVSNGGAAMAENAVSNITGNAFYGADCRPCSDYWTTSLGLSSVISYNINANKFIGTSGTPVGIAILINKTTAAQPVIFNILQNVFDYVGIAASIGDFVQGVTFAFNNCTGVSSCFSVPSGFAYGDNDELFIGPGNQFNTAAGGIAIDIESPVRHTNVFDNYCVVLGATNCMVFNNYAMTTVSGNHCINIGGGGGNCIVFGTYSNDASLVYGNQTQFFQNGIYLNTGSAHTSVFMNVGTSNTNDVLAAGSGNNIGLAAFTGSTTSAFQVVNGIVIHQ